LLWANETLKRALDFRKANGPSSCPSNLLIPIIDDDDDDDISIQFNSIQFNLILIFLHENLTAQGPVTKLTQVRRKQ
jgi:hypothetical protein